jgi:hypothetical protein
MGNIKYYRGTFTKAAGDLRTMYFVRSGDLPNTFVNDNTKGTGKPRNLREGMETVWDLESKSWRTFNWRTADPEEIITFEADENILNNFSTSNVQ